MAGAIGINFGNKFWDAIKAEMIDLYVNRIMSTYELAEKYNCTPSTIRSHLKSWGVYDKNISNRKKNEYDDLGEYMVGYTRSEKYEFYIDKEQCDLIKEYCWHKHQDGYLRTCIGKNENGGNIYKLMHVMIMENAGERWTDSEEVDHINGRPNDNRLVNLRIVSHADNMKNHKIPATNKSGHSGVFYSRRQNDWVASIDVNGEHIHLGTFASKDDAVAIRKFYEAKYYGEHLRKGEDLYNGTR